MSQKFTKIKNTNSKTTAYGKYFARAVYNRKPVSTEEIAQYIQDNASVTSSDVKAVLDQLGAAMNHFFRRGEKVYLQDIGTFKVGFSSLGYEKADDLTANAIYSPRVLFQPETEHVPDTAVKTRTNKAGELERYTGYTTRKRMLEDIVFEETRDKSLVTT